MELRTVVIIAAAAAAASAQVPQRGTDVIAGTVIDEAGQPQPGAPLQAQKLNEYTRDSRGRMALKEAGFVRSVMSGADGRFALSDLPPGRYHVCAAGVRASQVGSCDWGGVPVIELAAVRVADPN